MLTLSKKHSHKTIQNHVWPDIWAPWLSQVDTLNNHHRAHALMSLQVPWVMIKHKQLKFRLLKMVWKKQAGCWIKWMVEGKSLLEVNNRKEIVMRTIKWHTLQAEEMTSTKPHEPQRTGWVWENARRLEGLVHRKQWRQGQEMKLEAGRQGPDYSGPQS